jgi:isopenicillin N synthase-like dioxygenase
MRETLPVIDMSPLFGRSDERGRDEVARRIETACRDTGFFYAVGHGVSDGTLRRLEEASRRFFALPVATKLKIGMSRGGKAWRGYFPVGGELTSGKPDLKEGIYLGTELPADHPRVKAGWPLHGANVWPEEVRLHGGDDARRACIDGRDRREPRSRGRLLFAHVHG